PRPTTRRRSRPGWPGRWLTSPGWPTVPPTAPPAGTTSPPPWRRSSPTPADARRLAPRAAGGVHARVEGPAAGGAARPEALAGLGHRVVLAEHGRAGLGQPGVAGGLVGQEPHRRAHLAGQGADLGGVAEQHGRPTAEDRGDAG